MIIRGLALPEFKSLPGTSELLDSYLATTEDTLFDLLHSGARWPEKLGSERRSTEVFAGFRALEDEGTSPDLHLAAISFAYLLYHWNLTKEAFLTLESINAYLSKHNLGTEDSPLTPSEDPYYVAGLMCSHGRWHGDGNLDDAISWFWRSLTRGVGLEYHGPVLGAIGLCLHRLQNTVAALHCYTICLNRLRMELEQELTDNEPIFHDYLQQQIDIFAEQRSRLSTGDKANAVMTKYGWAMRSTGNYEYWSPGVSSDYVTHECS